MNRIWKQKKPPQKEPSTASLTLQCTDGQKRTTKKVQEGEEGQSTAKPRKKQKVEKVEEDVEPIEDEED